MFDTLKRGAVAAVAVLAIAGCGGSSKKSTPSETDLLSGAGKFETTETQAQWHVNAVDGATLNEDPFVDCPAIAGFTGFAGKCAKINSSNLGDNNYNTQLAFWDPAVDPTTFKTVHLSADKQYVVKFAGAVVSDDDSSRPVSIWLQHCSSPSSCDWPPANGSTSIELPTTGLAYESPAFTVAADVDVHVVINLGPESTNSGTTFYIDNVQVIEQAKPPPPLGTDVLAGAGSFTDATAQGTWFINPPSQAGVIALTFPADCGAGFTGPCARLEGTDYGTNSYSTQLSYGQGTFQPVQLVDGKSYQIQLAGKVDGATGPVSISVWLQHGTDWPPANGTGGGTGPFALTSTAKSFAADTFTVSAPSPDGYNFVVNVGGPNSANGVFSLDDIQLIEIAP